MKYPILIVLCLLHTVPSIAQPTLGSGTVFTYTNGFRTHRGFNPTTAQLLKPGKNQEGQTADTIIFTLEKEKNATRIIAYPNPVYDVLFIENMSWTNGSAATIVVSDMSGRQIIEKNTSIPKENIDLKNLMPGSYVVNYYCNKLSIVSWKITKL